MAIAASILILLCWCVRRSNYVLFASVGYLIHAISLDLLALGLLDEQMEFGNIAPYSLEYFYSFVVVSFAFIIFTYLLKSGNDLYGYPAFSKKFVRLGFLFLLVSCIALILNLNRTGGVELMFIEPRLYELIFGESLILNYLYFLHLPAAILFVIAYISSRNAFYLFPILIALIFSLFHGIKFTIIHAFIYPALVLWIYSGYRLNKYIALAGLLFFTIIVAYFYEVRGGEADGLLGYITSPSMNALFLLATDDLVTNSPIGVITPDVGYFFSKFADRLFGIPMEISFHESFVLNAKYNLLPGWYSTSLIGLPSHLLVVALLAIIVRLIRSCYHPGVGRSVIEAHIYFTLLMSFTGWALFSFKIMYVLLILLSFFPLKRVSGSSQVSSV